MEIFHFTGREGENRITSAIFHLLEPKALPHHWAVLCETFHSSWLSALDVLSYLWLSLVELVGLESIPIASMYMVNVGKYSIHGWYGICVCFFPRKMMAVCFFFQGRMGGVNR